MLNRTSRLCLLFFLAITTAGARAELVARLSSTQIDETQTLELTIRTDSRDVQGTPDLQGLTADFEILTTRTSSQYRVINGNVQAWTDWIIALRPLRVGTLKVPPLSYRGEQTQPLELRVTPLDPELKKQMSDRVFFETKTEPERPFVQAQVVFIRRLLYADGTQIYGEMPDTPVVEDAVVIPLGNATSSTVTHNNERYGMIEQRYALFPERSGPLTIPGAVVAGSVRMNINGRLRRNGVRVVAEPITLDVRPIPPDYPDNTPWLPATRVDLLEAWDNSPPTFTLGQPLSQTLIVRADAATGSIIPPPDYDIPDSHFRSYPAQPDIVDNQRGGGLIGTRSQTWSLIPTAVGQTTLPMVELTWFDTQREEVRVSRLASRSVTVTGNATQPPAETPGSASGTATAEDQPAASVSAADRTIFSGFSALALSLIVGAMFWLGYPWLRARITLPDLTPQKVVRNRSKTALVETIAHGSVGAIRHQLQATLRDFEATQKPIDPEALERIYALLSAAAYAPVTTEPDRKSLAEAVEALLSPAQHAAVTDTLPALYPSATGTPNSAS